MLFEEFALGSGGVDEEGGEGAPAFPGWWFGFGDCRMGAGGYSRGFIGYRSRLDWRRRGLNGWRGGGSFFAEAECGGEGAGWDR